MLKIESQYFPKKSTSTIFLGASLKFASHISKGKKIAIIIDKGFLTHYSTFAEELAKKLDAKLIAIAGGERCKSRETKAYIEDELLREGYNKDTHLVAIGGGATLDVVGYTAATFCRGVLLTLIPTTLVAMTDAAIGGKNGINLHGIKNCIGTLYPPVSILVDIDFLKTLSRQEIQHGLVEMMKHALLRNSLAVERLIKNIPKICDQDSKTVLSELFDSIQYKCQIVESSMKRPSMRDLLNFGHTVGHAIEYMNLGWSHGQAVAKGILVESELSYKRGLLPREELRQVVEAISAIDLAFPTLDYTSTEEWKRAFFYDKKTEKNVPRVVLLAAIGEPYVEDKTYAHPLSETEINAIIGMLV